MLKEKTSLPYLKYSVVGAHTKFLMNTSSMIDFIYLKRNTYLQKLYQIKVRFYRKPLWSAMTKNVACVHFPSVSKNGKKRIRMHNPCSWCCFVGAQSFSWKTPIPDLLWVLTNNSLKLLLSLKIALTQLGISSTWRLCNSYFSNYQQDTKTESLHQERN